jgi:type I restriction enzyme S subunit
MELKPGYKQTEVGVIPEEWEVKPLKRLSPSQSVGLVINPSTYFDKAGTVPLLVGSNVSENAIDSTTSNRITKESNEKLPASRLVAGDLVMVRVGEPGVTAVVPPELDGCNCASMMIVRQHSSFDSHWLCCMMNSRHGRQQVEHVQYGTAQKQFNISDAVDFQYPVPPLPEQRAIATALSDVDGLLGGLDRLIAKKRDLKQAAMQQLLTGQTRLPGFHGEWEVKRLGDVLKVRHGKSQHGITAPDGRYPILASGGEIGRTNAYIYDQPSVLIGRKGTIDSPQYVDSPFWTVDTLFFTEISSDAHAKFVFYKFTMIRWRSYNEASGVPSLNAKTIENIEVTLPPVPEQTAIAEVLTDMDAELAALEQRREKTRALKQAMMQELLTGRTRLT